MAKQFIRSILKLTITMVEEGVILGEVSGVVLI